MSRRRMLAATGLAAGSLFLPSRRARAGAGGAPPKRLVIFYTQHGCVHGNWHMRPPGFVDGAALDMALPATGWSQVLAPLAPHRNKLLIVDGLAMASCEADAPGNGHDIGTRHSLTNAFLDDTGAAGGASIDQVVAPHLRVDGRIDSLELAVMGAMNGGAVWRAPGQSLPADAAPWSVYGRVFGAGPPAVVVTDADRVAAAQPSVLDVVRAEYAALAQRLSGEDRRKLELHRDLVRDLETRLVMPPPAQCNIPGAPSGRTDYASLADSMFSLTTAALACDMTRVVTIQMGQLGTDQIGAPPGDVHADYAHKQEIDPIARQMMTNYGNVHAQQFGQLLSMLDAVPEGNGTLLDNCAVVWCSELADGVHHFRPWWAAVGGGVMRAGRYVCLPSDIPNPQVETSYPDYQPLIGRPHARFWVSVAQAVGAPVTSLGETSLVTPAGLAVNCTGPLAELA